MYKKGIGLMSLFVIAAVVVAAGVIAFYYSGYGSVHSGNGSSGASNTASGESTFSNSNVSFQYPSTWSTKSLPLSALSSNSGSTLSTTSVLNKSYVSIVEIAPSSMINSNVSALTSNFAATRVVVLKTNSTYTANNTAISLLGLSSLMFIQDPSRIVFNTTSPGLTKGAVVYGFNVSGATNTQNVPLAQPNFIGFLGGYYGSTAFYVIGFASGSAYTQEELGVLNSLSQTLGT